MSKDLFYRELHSTQTQNTLRTFAQDKNLRTLIVARIDPALPSLDEKSGAKSSVEQEDGNAAAGIRFLLKVEYLGQSAHSIAFVKREGYQVLELRGVEGKHLSS